MENVYVMVVFSLICLPSKEINRLLDVFDLQMAREEK